MEHPVWARIEQRLPQMLSLPHNVLSLRAKGQTPETAAKEKLAEIRSGLTTPPVEETFTGPRVFLRVAGATNRVYAGEWWFDADLHDRLNMALSRVYFTAPDRKAAVRDLLRELLAVSTEWNAMTEVWVLALPAGQQLVGYVGIGAPQHLFANKTLTATGNRWLTGKARQIYFPVKNPLWVTQLRDL